jgi:transposase
VAASERDRPDVARRRAQGTERQDQIDPQRLVFIDETWVKTNMEPLRGWAPLGERLIAKVPHGHWRTSTFIAALRCDRIEAPWILDGPVNAEAFKTYVEKVLTPTLKPGDLVIMDNLASHKGKAVRQAIRAAGAKLIFLPKYSPDLNPIEQVFAKLKHLLRNAAARTIETLTAAVGELLGAFTATECANYFANSGYART